MCYPKGEFRVGGNDVYLGEIGGCPVYMDADQFDYWKHTQLIIDVVPGRGVRLLARGAGRRALPDAQPRVHRRRGRCSGKG